MVLFKSVFSKVVGRDPPGEPEKGDPPLKEMAQKLAAILCCCQGEKVFF